MGGYSVTSVFHEHGCDAVERDEDKTDAGTASGVVIATTLGPERCWWLSECLSLQSQPIILANIRLHIVGCFFVGCFFVG